MTSQSEVGTDWVREQLKHGEPVFFIEVRHAGDRDLAVMKARGALRLTSDQASKQIAEIPKEGTLVVYSSAPDDEPATLFAGQLLNHGFTAVHVLAGGFKAYLSAGLPVEDVGEGRNMSRLRGL